MEALLAQRKRIRSPVGAGIFYPEEKREILKYLRAFNLEAGKNGHARAIVAPHGAWDFSGALAANAFSCAMGRRDEIKRVVILGPIHDKREKGIFLSTSYSFQTPLGNIPVDRRINEELKFSSDYIEIDDIPHLGEHSIEILLPFVKYCFPKASIVPILMGQPSVKYINDLSRALKAVITPLLDETLLVISCNLSCGNDAAEAQSHAEECLRLFVKKDAPALSSAIIDGSINPCGGSLVACLFKSGLLNRKSSCCAADYMVSAVGMENDVIFYSSLSYE